MRKPLMLLSVIALSVAAFSTADARPRKGGENTAQEQNLKLKAEWQQARQAGGYPDPVSALIALFDGTLPENAVQPVINDPKEHDVTYPVAQ